MKKINNYYITEETIAYVNEILSYCYDVKLEDIWRLETDDQKAIEGGWASTDMANESQLNNIPLWIYRAIYQHLETSYERRQDKVLSYINLDTAQNIVAAYASGDISDTEMSANNRFRVSAPNGYHGNDSYIYFLVPNKIIKEMMRSEYDITTGEISWAERYDSADYVHPLDWNVEDRFDSQFPNQGMYRTDALLFYSNFTKNLETIGNDDVAIGSELMLDYVQHKDYIDIIYSTANLNAPFTYATEFERIISPWVQVVINFFRRGVQV